MTIDDLEEHNPERFDGPGDGYRFLSKREVHLSVHELSAIMDGLLPRSLFLSAEICDCGMWRLRTEPRIRSFYMDVTYRVPLTAETTIKPTMPSRWPNWDLLCKT